MHVNYKQPKLYPLTPSRKRLGKSIARGSCYLLAVQTWEDPKIKQYILKLISVTIRREISTMCSDKTNSLLLGQEPDSLNSFNWRMFESELDKFAPTFSHLLCSCFTTRIPRQNATYMLCMCASLMLRNRRATMSLLQKIISVVLYCGHCSKQLQLIIVCLYTVWWWLVHLDNQSATKAGSLPKPQCNNPTTQQTWIRLWYQSHWMERYSIAPEL